MSQSLAANTQGVRDRCAGRRQSRPDGGRISEGALPPPVAIRKLTTVEAPRIISPTDTYPDCAASSERRSVLHVARRYGVVSELFVYDAIVESARLGWDVWLAADAVENRTWFT